MNDLRSFSVPSSSTLIDAVERIERNGERAVMVIEGEKLIGLISQGDIMRALLKGTDIHSPLASFARQSFRFLPERDEQRALEIFKKDTISMIPIVDEQFHLVDVITLSNVLQRLEFSKT